MPARPSVRLLCLLAAALMLAAGDAWAVRLSGSFTPVAPGLEVAEGTLALDDPGGEAVDVTLLRVDPAVRAVRIATPASLAADGEPGGDDRPPAGGRTLRGYLDGLGATAVAAGGLLASFSPPTPLGLVVVGGRVASPPHRAWPSSGLFCAGGPDGAARIRPIEAGAAPAGAGDCIQSGPLLIGPAGAASADGLRRSIGVDYSREFVEAASPRTFVALDRRGRVLLGATGPLDLPGLAAFLAFAADPAVLDLAAALNLTGGETAGLLLRADAGTEVRAGSPDGAPLPNAIAVLGPREPARAPTPGSAG